ncbi:MAG: hypothetical protein IPI11_06530 [Haliscomenobacter sp.]|nr:hypothetical protein [Haliscomenobacter sp.]
MMQMTLGYPVWYVGLCVLASLFLAGFLYYRESHFQGQAPWLKWTLGFIRFLAVFILTFFLLGPVLRSRLTEIRKPIVLIAQDASESVGASLSRDRRKEYLAQLDRIEKELGDDFEVRTYSFGESVREGLDTGFQDKVSNLSEMLRFGADLFGGENLGAVLLATDGIYNEGSNPIYSRTKLGAPVFALALGDTVPKKDLVLKRVFHNKIAYLGDQFTVQADIAAVNCAGAATTLSVYKVQGESAQLLQKLPVQIDRKDFFDTRELVLDADKSGVQRYRLTLSSVAGEAVAGNNVQEIFVDVLDARQKILILAHAPHPDLSALRQSLLNNKNYQVETAFINDFKGALAGYDFVIFHQLPSRTNNLNSQLAELNRNRTPRWFIAGLQADFNRLNEVQNLLVIQADARSVNEVQARVAGNFNLFLIDEQIRNELGNYPPLSAPFGEFRSAGQAQTFLFQRIRKIDTEYPLLSFGDPGGVRTGVLAAEGLWRWRLFNYLQNENHVFFDNLLSKMVQYLSVKEDKRKFRVSLAKNIFDENEPVVFDAELYNNTFELINEPDVRLTLVNQKGKEFNFTFNKSGRAYSLNAGILPVGEYRFRASVNNGGETLTFEGQCSVRPIQLELFETTADHGILATISRESGGRLLYQKDLAGFSEMVRGLNSAKPVIYQTVRTRPLINLRWLFGILIGLLSLEWFLRRYFGSY